MNTSFEKEFDWKKYFIVSENVIRQKEHSEIEFKESFQSPKHKDKKLHKWIASFANANGGLIIYGVKNNGELIGLKNNKLREFDNKDLSQELLGFFAPEIKFELFTKEIEGFELGFLYVYKSNDKPVVAIKSASETIQESDIFYRYPGQSRRISYGDLRNIMEEKYNRLNERWLKLMNNVATIGVENVGILNIENGELMGSGNKLLIPEELLEKISFINEGSFVEKDGAPTLKLIGDVLPIDSNKVIQLIEKKYQIITHFELYKSFFEQDLDMDSAKEFFRKVAYENTEYYPIYYYIVTSKLSPVSVEKLLLKEKGPKVSNLKTRLYKEKSNYNRFEIGNIKSGTDAAKSITSALDSIKNKSEIDLKNLDSASLRYLIQAITHLKTDDIDISHILYILKELYDNHFNQSDTTKSFIRKAICHVDLVIFGKQYFERNE
ncbi:AlbA family DNA-binding domain-containing protein [Anaerophaga thermohalophila]|uniref:AlbA family DNA-binding domain-containing protein n=1 Tax=Anaerophaga thermohalophila TaxID=177400 RepID=UPI0002F93EED|nr:ATP-binding protein [Anaerophaga thermohalophila]